MADPTTTPDLQTRGVFEDAPRSGVYNFAQGLNLDQPRDFAAERRPIRERQEQTFDARQQTVTAAKAETERQATTAESDATRDAAARKEARPRGLDLPPAPSPEARPFLSPGPSVLSQIQSVALGIGNAALQVKGLHGSAVAAVVAMRGMAQGWQEGDAERVKREQAAWKHESDRLIALHEDAIRSYRDVLEDQKLSSDQKRTVGALRLKGYDWQAAMEALQSDNLAAQLKELDAAEARHTALVEKARQFDEALAEKARYHDVWAEIQGDARKERAREADQRFDLALRRFKASAATTGPNFTPEALEMHANVVANGGALPALGWGKAATDARITISNRAAEIRKGRGDEAGSLLLAQMSQRANQAELNKIQSQRGPMLAFAATAEKNLDLALKLSDTVDREQYPAFNRWLLSGELKWAGDPSVAAFAAATRVAINETAKVTNSATGGGVSTDTARREIEDMLSTALNPEQFKAVAGVLKTDMHNRIRGYDEQIAATKAAITGGGAGPSETPRWKVVSPDGRPATVPAGTDLSKFPGWKRAD